MEKILYLEDLSCPSCVAKINAALKNTKGVLSYEVLFNSSRVKIDVEENSLQDAIDNVEKLGYKVERVK